MVIAPLFTGTLRIPVYACQFDSIRTNYGRHEAAANTMSRMCLLARKQVFGILQRFVFLLLAYSIPQTRKMGL